VKSATTELIDKTSAELRGR